LANRLGRAPVRFTLFPTAADVESLWQTCQQDGYDYCVTLLPTSPKHAVRPDILQVPLQTWRTSVVGQLPTQSPDRTEGLLMAAWEYALDWATHMTLPVVILPPLPEGDDMAVVAYARRVAWAAHSVQSSGCKLWIPLTLHAHALRRWSLLLQLADYPSNVGMLVQFESYAGTTPAAGTAWVTRQLHTLHLAMGAGVIYGLSLDCQQFLTNKKGYPTLSKVHQSMLTFLLRRVGRTIRLIVAGPPPASAHSLAPAARGASLCLPHLQYLQYLRKSRHGIRAALDTSAARLESDYLDALQQPLQPLKDHLENQTYEVFEKDPIKYREYQRAITMALEDRAAQTRLVLMVVGAGRGPLVQSALQAYQSLDPTRRPRQFSVWAIEKNPSAVRRLQACARYQPDWRKHGVQVVETDLRHLTAQMIGGLKADIVVSELLGSFGCNELSPECLDGLWSTNAVHDKTISIPSRYTSHIAPVASVKLWTQARQQGLYPNTHDTGVLGATVAMETPYVVRAHAASQMMAPKDCWTFCHPNPHSKGEGATTLIHDHPNNRMAVVDFEADPKVGIGYSCGYGPLDAETAQSGNAIVGDGNSGAATLASVLSTTSSAPWICTGLLGSFTAILYQRRPGSQDPKDLVYLSTSVDSFSEGMFSWFPLYFPIQPLPVPAGAVLQVHLWRKVLENQKVWYEWAVAIKHGAEVVSMTSLYNRGGRSYHVSL
jgi:protein arginine N-methyltransferase 5